MSKLDRSKPYGTITPPWEDNPDFDRPAHFEQGGRYFDAQDREIIAGEPAAKPARAKAATQSTSTDKAKNAAPTASDEANPLDHDGDGRPGGSLPAGPALDVTAAELLARMKARTIAWNAAQKSAKRILGGDCPAGKAAIMEALKVAAQAGSKHKPAPEKSNKKEAPDTGGIDLAAWGRGQKEYLFDEVRKAIRKAYHVGVNDRRAAIEVLLDENLITADEARQDL